MCHLFLLRQPVKIQMFSLLLGSGKGRCLWFSFWLFPEVQAVFRCERWVSRPLGQGQLWTRRAPRRLQGSVWKKSRETGMGFD